MKSVKELKTNLIKHLEEQQSEYERLLFKIGPFIKLEITEQQLQRLGFKQCQPIFANVNMPYWVHNAVCLFYNESDLKIHKSEGLPMHWLGGYGFTFDCVYYAATFKWIRHTHELQNLYFVLTGQEIEI